MLILADGRVVACDQDFAARHVLGDLARQDLRDVWSGRPAPGSAYAALRQAHDRGDYSELPLCGRCVEWHRP